MHGIAELDHRFRPALISNHQGHHPSAVIGIGCAAGAPPQECIPLCAFPCCTLIIIGIKPFHLQVALVLGIKHPLKLFQIINKRAKPLHICKVIGKFSPMLFKLIHRNDGQSIPVFSFQIIHLLFQKILELSHPFQIRFLTACYLCPILRILGFPGQIFDHAPDVFRAGILHRLPSGQIGQMSYKGF